MKRKSLWAAWSLGVAFIGLILLLKSGSLQSGDDLLGRTIRSWRSSVLTGALTFLAELGAIPVLLVMLVAVAAWFYFARKRWLEPLILFLAMGGAAGLNSLCKAWIQRVRPTGEQLIEATGYSFPSGNAMVSAAFVGMAVYLWAKLGAEQGRRWKVLSGVLFVFLIGASRVYLGVHYPSDILAGFVAGGAWLSICIGFYGMIDERKRRSR